jgi:antitoxin component of MazEF toxin-antitoxin module
MKRKLIKFSNYSFCITLPKKAVEQLGWTKGQEVEVNFDSKNKRIIVGKAGRIVADKPKTVKAKKTTDKSDDTQEIQPIPQLRW